MRCCGVLWDETDIMGLARDVKEMQKQDAFCCNTTIAVPPVAKTNVSNFS